MAVTISASLVSAVSPRPVQVVVNGLPAGTTFTVVGTAGDGSAWPVPGGFGVADGGQVVLVDNRSALNTPVTYVLTAAGATYAALPVTVAHSGHVLQSLDGQLSARIRWIDNGDPRELDLRSTTFAVPGRARPPVRFAAAGDGGGELVMETVGSEIANMHALLASGRPLVLRTDGPVPFMPAVELVLPVRGSHRIYGADTRYGDTRRWTVPYLLVDDPEPGTALAAFTWDDFDEAMAARTWSALLTRTNRLPTPNAAGTAWVTTSAGATATASNETSGGPTALGGPSTWRKMLLTSAPTTTSPGVNSPLGVANMAAVTPGETVTGSAYGILTRAGVPIRAALFWYDSAGASITPASTNGTPSPSSGGWEGRSVTAVVPAGAAYARVGYFALQTVGTIVAGDYMGATGGLIEGGSVLGAYFDGATPDTSDTDYAWTGAANASTSTATGPDPASFDGLFAASTWDQFDVFDWDQL